MLLLSLVCFELKDAEGLTMLFRIDEASSSLSSVTEAVLHGESRDEGSDDVLGRGFLPLELFLKTLHTTNSSCTT